MRFFAKIGDTFTVPGRGCVVIPLASAGPDWGVRKGDSIQLRSPHRETISTYVASVELLKPVSGPCQIAFLLPNDVEKSDILPETEIWLE